MVGRGKTFHPNLQVVEEDQDADNNSRTEDEAEEDFEGGEISETEAAGETPLLKRHQSFEAASAAMDS